jgi:hypothetical protein
MNITMEPKGILMSVILTGAEVSEGLPIVGSRSCLHAPRCYACAAGSGNAQRPGVIPSRTVGSRDRQATAPGLH